jgi:hypothetical protein
MSAPSPRWWIYSASLIFAVGASIWVTMRGPRNVVAAAPVARATPSKVPLQLGVVSSGLEIPVRDFPEPALAGQIRDPFSSATASAQPSAPTPAVPSPGSRPPPPTVPPLPFSYRGILTDSEGIWIVQLARGNEYLLVERGEVIDSTYRLDDLKNDELIFTYLPMSVAQTLPIYSVQP